MRKLICTVTMLLMMGCTRKPVTEVADGPVAKRLELGGNLTCLEITAKGTTGWPARADGMCYNADRPIFIDIHTTTTTGGPDAK